MMKKRLMLAKSVCTSLKCAQVSIEPEDRIGRNDKSAEAAQEPEGNGRMGSPDAGPSQAHRRRTRRAIFAVRLRDVLQCGGGDRRTLGNRHAGPAAPQA